MIEVKEISLDSKKDKKKFFKFLIDLYKGNKYAAPNFYFDEFAEFDPAVNDAYGTAAQTKSSARTNFVSPDLTL